MPNQYFATNRKVGDGSTTVWEFSFAGARPDANNGTEPYLEPEDVGVALVDYDDEGREHRTPINFSLTGPAQVTITPAIAAGQDFVIFRETESDLPVSDFTDFASISEQDLDNSFRQTLFVVQEMRDRTQDAADIAGEARQVAGEALLVAEAAEHAAEDAVVTAEAANQSANNALLTANTAVDIAEAAEDSANSAVSTANDALDTASSAETLANQALAATDAFTDRVDTIEQVSDQASLDAGAALQASSEAVQDASEALTLANQAVGTADSAMDLTNTFEGRLDDFEEVVDGLVEGGSITGLMFKHENLAGLEDVLEARNNLGLGDLATQDLEHLDLGTAASRNVGSGDEQIRTNNQNDARYYTQAQVNALLSNAVPTGVITMWSGSTSAIPSGWALCNGSNGTPDLRDRFIVGAGSSYAVGDTGGANSVTLTSAQMPAHNHSVTVNSGGAHSHTASTGSAGSHSHSGSASSAGAHTHSLAYRIWNNTGVTNPRYTIHQADPKLQGTSPTGTNGHISWATASGNYYRANSAGAHTHSLSINSNGAHTHTVSVASGGAHTHTASSANTGGGESHENRPPYYALAYIMKL